MSRGPVKIERYTPAWSIEFEKLKDELIELMGENFVEIHHVGSTAVEGLGAKPIIDILVTVTDIPQAEGLVESFTSSDFEYVPKYEKEMPYRRYFVRRKEESHLVHLHVVPHGHEFHHEHLLFRDFLRKHRDIRDEYFILKTRLANKHKENRDGYQTAKSEFIDRMMEMAREEFGSDYFD
ncbi:MAG: GrpB family protein [Candidatus Kariarchaeaceae archaeon]|jgi:GrpB-like predicted nucleotidyltransferase (UPF0157 family)